MRPPKKTSKACCPPIVIPQNKFYDREEAEKEEVVAICDHLQVLKYSPQLPYVFTEYGAVMLASVLNSERAIEVNIQIVRIFTQMREMLLSHKDILLKLEQLERKVNGLDEDIQLIFSYLKELLNPPSGPRPRIGFRRKDEKD